MLNRQRSLRFVFAGLALFLITSVSFASPWTTAMKWLGFSGEQAAAESPAPALMAPGTCDTAGPIEVEGTILGTTPTAYATLGLAVAAINAGTHTGAISIDVCGDTTEATASIVLNASGSGAASYTSISMIPVGGSPRTITAATTAGNPMIDFNGADNVTIDGLNTGGNSLTIANTTASATSGTSTFRFIGGATNNTITNSNIQGSSSASVATNGATIFFSTDGVTANGNDNNTISNNNIGPAGSNLPTKAILGNGSTTTTAIGNSGIVINNNNIFDYFGAAVTSSGIATNGGSNTWTITNNRMYQTAARTWTTGSLHIGIDLRPATATSGAQGHTVTGNIIGYASNTQTGTYTLTGAGTGAKFVGIFHNGISTGTTSNINNNTIAAISMTGVTGNGTSTSSPFTGILFQEGNGITNGNTIGSQSGTGSLNFSTTTTSATDVYGIYNFSSNAWTSNNNNVGGISVTNLGASGTFIVYGMRAFTGSTVTWNATSNNVGGTVANSIQLNGTGAGSQVIGMFTSNCPMVLTSNTIRNLTSNIGTGVGTGASVAGILNTSTTPNSTLSQNTIFNLTNTNATAASVVTGIQFTGSTANVVERNFIYGISVASNSNAAEVNGIRVGGGTTTYRNNMIAVGAGTANAIGVAATNAGTVGINGINEAGGTNNFFHNSVYIGGAPTAGTGTSYAFNATVTGGTRSFRNNIFYNGRANSGATGKNYALKLNGTAPNPAGLTINNNVYFISGAGTVLGFYNSLDVVDLPSLRTAVGQDAASIGGDPVFIDPTNATPDLHIHPTNATPIDANGADVGVTNDFDGQTRSGLTPVDIGADAGNYNGIDLSPPIITYTPLGNTSSLANRVLSVTITDVVGVATGGLAPRIYFNKNNGTYFSTACSLGSGTLNNGTWNCTIDNTQMGGVAVTDVIRYFVVAQDTNGNLGSNPSGGFAGTNVNTVTTPPTTPNQYTIVNPIGGSLNVGSGETYTSLTNAGGLFEAINNSDVTSNITVNITSDLTGELGTVALNEFASGFTILIKPSGAPRSITGSNTSALIRLNAADNVRFDGSTAATIAPHDNTPDTVGGNPALRELTIQNTNTGLSAVVMSIGSNGANGAQNNSIKNATVLGQDPTTTLAIIAMGGATPGTGATGPNNGNRIENCLIGRSIYGIYASGQSAANQNTGTVIRRNETSATTGDRIRRIGIVLFNEDGAQVTENSINGINTNESTDAVAIGLGAQGVDNALTTAGGVTNANVSRNKINGVASLSATGFSAVGIAVAGGNTGANTISNNMITGVTAPATSPDLPAGIFVAGTAGSSTRVYHNSVAMTGDRGSVASQVPGFGIGITGTNPTVELKNNIFYTTQTSAGSGTDDKSFAIGMTSTTFTNLDSNGNAFLSSGANAAGYRTGGLGAAGTDHATLAAWQAAVSDDADSFEGDPTFVDPLADLHLLATSPVLSLGQTLAAVTNDYDNDPRPAASPDMGADELVQVHMGSFPSGTFYNAILTPGTYTGNVEVTNSLTINGGVSGVNIGANTLTIGCNATVNGAGGYNYIVGNVEKDFCAAGTFTFPVGTTPNGSRPADSGNEKPTAGQTFDPEGVVLPEYTPVDANITAGTFPSSLTVSVTDAFLPQIVQANGVSRFWTVEESGTLTADLTFHYLDAPFDANGNESLYKAFRRSGGFTTEYVPSSNNPAGNTFTATGVTNFSDWGAGAAAATSANASISGRVTTASGNGIRNATVMITGGSLTEPMIVRTGAFGYYSFDNLRVGETYVIQIGAKRFRFENPTRVITLQEAIADLDFVANPQE